MNKLLATLISSTLAISSSAAFGQGASPAPAPDKGSAAAYQNPAAEKTQAEKAKEGMTAAEKSKMDAKSAKPNVHDPAVMKAQQDLTRSGTSPEKAKANVEASKNVARKTPTNVKDMTPEERAAWRKQMQEQSKP